MKSLQKIVFSGLRDLGIFFLICFCAGNVFAHSYQVCIALRAQICQDYYPPSMRLECLIGNIGACANHSHGNGGFVPVELPFGSRTFPAFDEMMENEEISAEYKAMAREALDAFRLYEEARVKEFNAILRTKRLTKDIHEGLKATQK